MISRKLERVLRDQGFSFQLTRSLHIAVFKDGVRVATFSRTPSDYRTQLNEIAQLRSAGAIIPRKGERHRGHAS